VVNNGLPLRADALVHGGLAARDESDRVQIRGAQRLERTDDRLTFLGDIVPIHETGQVLSFGDLLILAGVADIAANLTLRRRARASRPRRLPRNAEVALVAIAPPPERVDADPVVDMRQLEQALVAGYAERPDDVRFIDLRTTEPPAVDIALPRDDPRDDPRGEREPAWPPAHLRRHREPRAPRIPRGLDDDELDGTSLARTRE
jgi:hypothetical protein